MQLCHDGEISSYVVFIIIIIIVIIIITIITINLYSPCVLPPRTLTSKRCI